MSQILYILLGILGLFMLLQLSVRFRGWFRRGKPAPKVGGSLGQSIDKGGKILAYFYSPSCSACRTQEKYINLIQKNFKAVYRINAAKDRSIASAFGVMGTPTTVIIEKGIIKEYFTGVTPTKKLKGTLQLI
ncbi:MAG: thioredoxin family protein [Calditrichaeota bacterium]|nr:thioredoxin family protein [Calditrichota bacterium]